MRLANTKTKLGYVVLKKVYRALDTPEPLQTKSLFMKIKLLFRSILL